MFELISSDFPKNFANDCAHQGQCDDDVAYWLSEIGLALEPQEAREALEGYGAWETEELQDHQQNLARILWLAANDFKEHDGYACFE